MVGISLWEVAAAIPAVMLLVVFLLSWKFIGSTEVGLVQKRFGRPLPDANPVAFNGEAGYQAKLLMPGWRFRFWLL